MAPMASPGPACEHRLRWRPRHGDQRLRRSSGDRVLAGVAGGIGERLGVDPVVLRLAFVVLSLAGGVGVVLYLVLFLVMGWPDAERGPVPTPRTSARQALAVVLVVAGLLLSPRRAGLWFGDRIVWPVVLAAAGSAVMWTRGDGCAPRAVAPARVPDRGLHRRFARSSARRRWADPARRLGAARRTT